MVVQHVFANPQHLVYLYLLSSACGGLVVLSDLLAQLDEVSSRAMTRARLAQAEADIVSQSSRRGRVARARRERRAAHRQRARGRRRRGLRGARRASGAARRCSAPRPTRDALCYAYDELVVLRHALEHNEVLSIHDVRAWFAERGLTPPAYLYDFELQRVLVVPLRAFDLGLGAMVFNRAAGYGALLARAGAVRRQRRRSRGRGRRERSPGRPSSTPGSATCRWSSNRASTSPPASNRAR